jgi:hypothetical protein
MILRAARASARASSGRRFAAVALGVPVLIAFHLLLTSALFGLIAGGAETVGGGAVRLAGMFVLGECFTLFSLLAVYRLPRAWRRSGARRQRTRRLAQRAARAARAERAAHLAALQRELDAHLILNIMTSAAGVMRAGRTDDAVAMLARTGDLLRSSLEQSDASLVPLTLELELLERYLSVERARYGAQLDIECHVEPDTRAMLVPPLFLQPLVENAIRYSAAASDGVRVVRLDISATDDRLELRVRNADARPDAVMREGRGLSLARRRLLHHFGDAASLAVTRTGGEANVRVSLPARRTAALAQPDAIQMLSTYAR